MSEVGRTAEISASGTAGNQAAQPDSVSGEKGQAGSGGESGQATAGTAADEMSERGGIPADRLGAQAPVVNPNASIGAPIPGFVAGDQVHDDPNQPPGSLTLWYWSEQDHRWYSYRDFASYPGKSNKMREHGAGLPGDWWWDLKTQRWYSMSDPKQEPPSHTDGYWMEKGVYYEWDAGKHQWVEHNVPRPLDADGQLDRTAWWDPKSKRWYTMDDPNHEPPIWSEDEREGYACYYEWDTKQHKWILRYEQRPIVNGNYDQTAVWDPKNHKWIYP